MSRFALVLPLAMVAAVPAFGQDAAPSSDARPVKEKKICRRDAEIGSNMLHSVCHTRAEWAEIDRANGDAVRQSYAAGHQGMGRP